MRGVYFMMKNKRFVGIFLTVAMTVGMTANAFAMPWEKSSSKDISKSRIIRGIEAFVDGEYGIGRGGDFDRISDIVDGVRGIVGEGGGDHYIEGMTGFLNNLTHEPIFIAEVIGEGGFAHDGYIAVDEFGRLFFDVYREGGNMLEFNFLDLGPVLDMKLVRSGDMGAYKEGMGVEGGFDSLYALIAHYMGKDGEVHELKYFVNADGGFTIFNYEFVDGGLDIDPVLIIDGERVTVRDLLPNPGPRPDVPVIPIK